MNPVAVMAFVDFERAAGKQSLTSAYRCPAHNRALGGKPDSMHLFGEAFDFLCPDDEQEATIVIARAHGFVGIGRGKKFLHIDLGPERSWTYP
jgi:uncharacterized protein YcbK (DUF882 family)